MTKSRELSEVTKEVCSIVISQSKEVVEESVEEKEGKGEKKEEKKIIVSENMEMRMKGWKIRCLVVVPKDRFWCCVCLKR